MKKSLAVLTVLLIFTFILGIIPAGANITFGSRTLSLGMSGSDVSELQTNLKNFGFYSQKITGKFDKKTGISVKQFQRAHNLPADGIVNQDDYDKIAQLNQPATPEPLPDPTPTPEPSPEPIPDPTPTPEPAPTPAPGHIVTGYYTVDYPGDVLSYNSLLNFSSQINNISTFTYLADGNGNLTVTGAVSQDTINFALSKGMTPLALIHNYRNGGFSSTDAHNLLASSANRQRLIANMISILDSKGYKGVDIDLENIPPADRPYYTALVQEFKAALQPLGYITAVSIPAKTADSPQNSWSGAFDYAGIGQHADLIQLMTYDEHWYGGTPGPIASLPWVENVIKYATSLIPNEKIMLGIATYGYDWTATSTKVVTYNSVQTLLSTENVQPQWHSVYGVPYFSYYQNGIKHEVWYENADSSRLKFDLVNKYGLAGISIWRLGYEDASFWQAVSDKL